jgi:hypothetical protein
VLRRVDKVAFPPESWLASQADDATFWDAFEADLDDPALSPAELAARLFAEQPAWVAALIDLRDQMVRPLGLKTVTRLGRAVEDAGSATSLFSVVFQDEQELVLGADDRHLDVRISFLKRQIAGRWRYVLTSWVKTHNALGRVYMIPVGRIHPLIVKQAMRAVVV